MISHLLPQQPAGGFVCGTPAGGGRSAVASARAVLGLLVLGLLVGACGGNERSDVGSESSGDGVSDFGNAHALDAASDVVGTCGGEGATDFGTESDLPPGVDTFLSAAGDVGDTEAAEEDNPHGTAPSPNAMPGPAESDPLHNSAVHEGDIYRVLDDGRVLFLHRTHGLQVIDYSDPDDPSIIGHTQTVGRPVEMYVIGDQAWVLLNHWRGYASTHAEEAGESGPGAMLRREGPGLRRGGAVLHIDLSDPRRPEIRRTVRVPGTILNSRVVRSESRGEAALYVAASYWGTVPFTGNCEDHLRSLLESQGYDDEAVEWQMEDRRETGELERYCEGLRVRPWVTEEISHVHSFSLTGGDLQEVEHLDIGRWVTGVQTTPQMLIVAQGNHGWWRRGQGAELQLIDISSTSGEMRVRGGATAKGRVFSYRHMDIHGHILRVVSGHRWGSQLGNFIQTWDISDPDDPQPVDLQAFGTPVQGHTPAIRDTLFLGNRFFSMTFQLATPFHAFEITDEGIATEFHDFNEIVGSDRDNHFRPAFDSRRLIGIGSSDEDGVQRAVVSLFDITDLAHPEPLITRAEAEAQWTWSEAGWELGSFRVLEGAADALADDGTPETGLILIPFTGRDSSTDREVSAMQAFTFSETTVTRRGTIEHNTWVQHSFAADPEAQLVGSLSNARFSLFDFADPDAPASRNSLQLAPGYTSYLPLGELALRVAVQDMQESWAAELAQWDAWDGDWRYAQRMEIIRTDGHPGHTRPLGSLITGTYDHYMEMDGRIVAVGQRHGGSRNYSTHVGVFDVADPTQPRTLGTLQPVAFDTTLASLGHSCWHCWIWRPPTPQVWLLGDQLLMAGTQTLVDGRAEPRRMEVCSHRMPTDLEERTCDVDGDIVHCSLQRGRRTCERPLPDGEPACSEEGYRCVESHDLATGTLSRECEEPDRSLFTEEFCREQSMQPPVQERVLRINRIDLSDPTQPTEAQVVEFSDFDRSGSILQAGDVLYHSWAEGVQADGRELLRWYIQPLRMVDGALMRGEAINVPGIAMSIHEGYLLSEDRVWVEGRIRAALRVSRIEEDRVVLVGSHLFPEDRDVLSLGFEAERGHLLALTQLQHPWPTSPLSPFVGLPGQPTKEGIVSEALDARMEVFRFDGEGITPCNTIAGDHDASLRTVIGDLALLQIEHAVLVVDISNPDHPRPTAWHPIELWPRTLHEHQGGIAFPALSRGLYRLDPQERNLLE